MSASGKTLDPAFQGAGHKAGTEIWRIENFQPVIVPKSDYGKFYSGDSYIVMQTTAGKGGSFLYDIHYWIGKDTSQDEAGAAAFKTVELDSVLGGRAIQHRETQGYESDKFLSYFKPCIIPLEGGFASGFRMTVEEKFETKLYVCKGKRAVRVKQVQFARSSLNHDDVFILDTQNKIYQFNGANSNIQERAKALEVVQYLKDVYHEGKCDVAIIEDGKLVAESDSGEFWVLFGGFAPIGRKAHSDDDIIPEAKPPTLYCVIDGQLKLEEGPLSKALLENNKCYLLDCGAEMFVWVGRATQLDERKSASKATEDFLNNQNRPKATQITQVIQGFETHSFKSKFDSWPMGTATGTSGGEEGRGKVAALLKQQGVDLKGGTKCSPSVDEVPLLLESNGKIEVWRINGNAKTPLLKADIGKFYSGDCYIVLYTYHSGDKKEEYFLTYWIGKDSVADDQTMASQLADTMWNSLRGRPVLGRIYQGKEPPQFVAIFQPMVVFKGGVSSGYKKLITENNLPDETYTSDGIALIRVSGTAVHNNKTTQVDAVATSLSSTECFVLQSGNTIFIWHGNHSSLEQQQWAAKVAEFLLPGISVKHAKEGTESSAFWFALGGKQSYTSKSSTQDVVRDPHLYSFFLSNGKLEVTEIFNFCQDDLLTEDMMIFDTHAEVFIWIGQNVDPKEKLNAFDVGQKYVDHTMLLEGLSTDVALYKLTEGNEPNFFKTYFSWDNNKSMVQGNSFEKKVAYLFGFNASESGDKSRSSSTGGPTQRASALAALSSAFNPTAKKASTDRPRSSVDGPTQRAAALAALSSAFNSSSKRPMPSPPQSVHIQGSQRAAAVAALSSVLTAEPAGSSDGSTQMSTQSLSPTKNTSEDGLEAESDSTEIGISSEFSFEKDHTGTDKLSAEVNEAQAEVLEEQTEDNGETTFSYERLKAKSANPVRGIDYKKREAYLSEADFQKIFGMNKEDFYKQPRWKQDVLKRRVDLF